MREMDGLLGEEGEGGFNSDPRTEKRQAGQLTRMCADKKEVVPRFETVKSTLISG